MFRALYGSRITRSGRVAVGAGGEGGGRGEGSRPIQRDAPTAMARDIFRDRKRHSDAELAVVGLRLGSLEKSVERGEVAEAFALGDDDCKRVLVLKFRVLVVNEHLHNPCGEWSGTRGNERAPLMMQRSFGCRLS